MADPKTKSELDEILNAGRMESNHAKKLRMGLDMIEAHHDAAAADWTDGELKHFAELYFVQHRDQFPCLDEVACNSSSDPEDYVGDVTTQLMRWCADMVGRPLTYSQAMGHLEKRASYWLSDLVRGGRAEYRGHRTHFVGPSRVFPGTKVD